MDNALTLQSAVFGIGRRSYPLTFVMQVRLNVQIYHSVYSAIADENGMRLLRLKI